MATERGSLFESEDLRVDDFEVKKPPKKERLQNLEPEVKRKQSDPPPSELRKLGAEIGFAPRAIRRGRKRTGRTEQLNVKVTADVLRKFYRLADEQDWVLGEVLEHAIAALMREIDARKK